MGKCPLILCNILCGSILYYFWGVEWINLIFIILNGKISYEIEFFHDMGYVLERIKFIT